MKVSPRHFHPINWGTGSIPVFRTLSYKFKYLRWSVDKNPSLNRCLYSKCMSGVRNIAAALIVLVILCGAYFFLKPHLSSKVPANGTVVYTATCGPVSLEYREYLSVNKFEGSSGRYAFVYRKGATNIDIPVSARSFSEEGPYGGYVLPMSRLTNPPFPLTPIGRGENEELPAQVVIIDPSKFSQTDFGIISSCLRTNTASLYDTYSKYISNSASRNRGLNLYVSQRYARPGQIPSEVSFAGTAYVSEMDFIKYLDAESLRSHSE